MLQKAPYHSKGETLMELIIQEIAEVISLKYQEELNRLFTEERDISEFINATKEMLDGVGAKLVAEALERMDQAVEIANAASIATDSIIENNFLIITKPFRYILFCRSLNTKSSSRLPPIHF
jgi:hypothetical protein